MPICHICGTAMPTDAGDTRFLIDGERRHCHAECAIRISRETKNINGVLSAALSASFLLWLAIAYRGFQPSIPVVTFLLFNLIVVPFAYRYRTASLGMLSLVLVAVATGSWLIGYAVSSV